MPSLGDFFICRDYEPKSYALSGGRTQVLDALAAAATDFDLTGQIVWLVSHLTSYYLSVDSVREELRGKPALELGCGAGLAGLVATQVCSQVILTDNEPEVLKLMDINLKHAAATCDTRCFDLSWGSREDESRLASVTGRARWPVLIGADVIYWSHAIPLLFDTVAHLLAPDGVFILGYFNRVSTNKEKVESLAATAGLQWTCVDHSTYLAADAPPAFADHLHKMTLYRFTWAPGRAPAEAEAAAAALAPAPAPAT